MSTDFGKIARDGLWDKNIVVGQMLALCPTLAITGTATNGLGMGLATTAVLILSNAAISALRPAITPEIRIPAFVLVIAAIVTVVDLALNAWVHDLHKVLGLFIALIVTNCAILGRAEAFASRHGILASAFDGLTMGVGFTLALVLVGAVRELVGSGTLFAQASVLLGPHFAFMEPHDPARLSGLPDRHPAAGRLHPARGHPRAEVDRRQPQEEPRAGDPGSARRARVHRGRRADAAAARGGG